LVKYIEKLAFSSGFFIKANATKTKKS
jgi:hypothetical protein